MQSYVGSLTVRSSAESVSALFSEMSGKIQDHADILRAFGVYKHEQRKSLKINDLESLVASSDYCSHIRCIDMDSHSASYEITYTQGESLRTSLTSKTNSWLESIEGVHLDLDIQFVDSHEEIDAGFNIRRSPGSSQLDDALQRLLTIAKNIQKESRAGLSKKDKMLALYVGASSSFVFGIIDNGVMIVGGDLIDAKIVALGFDSMTAAGFGNTLSDMVGVACGGMVFQLLRKILGVKGDGTMTQQLIGITIGCLIPVFVKMTLLQVG